MDDLSERFERTQWDLFWLPAWAEVVDRPELLYTVSDRPMSLWNQVTRVRASAARLPALVDEVDRAHAAVPSRWMLADASRHPALAPLLRERGWVEGVRCTLRVIASTARIDTPEDIVVRPVSDAASLITAIRTAEQAFGREPSAIPDDRIADELAMCTGPEARVHRFVAYDAQTDTPLAYGGLSTFPALGVGLLWGGGTVPAHRQRGAYRSVLAARLQRAASFGCDQVGLYARVNTSDPIVEALGFGAHGSLAIWDREQPKPA